jgi:hypothetical protein
MRVWRALKASGAAALRDGVYLLPDIDGQRAVFEGIAEIVAAAGGSSNLMRVAEGDHARLFKRDAEYARIESEIVAWRDALRPETAHEAARQARRWRKDSAEIEAIDFFPDAAQARLRAALDDFEAATRALLHPDEPTPRHLALSRRDPGEYRRRLWATRRRPWVDRLASAWLIRRHIDPEARFLWLAQPADCPDGAVGFDFDGAEFSHVGARVSFETLLASFGLEADAALARLARTVHGLDVGGPATPEAAGVEAMLAGMRAGIDDDDALLDAASAAFDYLYTAFKDTP